jgi:hypothetical protein
MVTSWRSQRAPTAEAIKIAEVNFNDPEVPLEAGNAENYHRPLLMMASGTAPLSDHLTRDEAEDGCSGEFARTRL